MQISVFGEVAVDHVFHIRAPRTNLKWPIEKRRDIAGGAGANVAATYNALGCDVDFFTGVSDNPRHHDLYKYLEQAGIRIINVAPGEISEIYDLVFPNEGGRTVAVCPGKILEDVSLALDDVHCMQSDILHVTPVAMKAAIRIPRMYNARIKVLSPAAEFIGGSSEQFRDLIQRYDVLCLEVAEARQYTNLISLEDILDWFSQIKRLCTVITQGDQGATCIFRGTVAHAEPAQLPLPVVDTMGCGDVFAATFAYFFLSSEQDVSYALAEASCYARYMAAIDGMWLELLNKRLCFKEKGLTCNSQLNTW